MKNKQKISDKKTWRFVGGFLLFCASLYILDLGVGSFLKSMYFKQYFGDYYLTTYSFDSTTADCLIIGSSTANHNYKPKILEKGLNTSVYNTGRDGTNIFYDYAVLLAVLKRYTPKMIILDFNISTFEQNQLSYDRIAPLLPYYSSHPEFRSIIFLKSPYEKYKFISKIYPYNSLLFSEISRNRFLAGHREILKEENGYIPLLRHWKHEIELDTLSGKYPIDSNAVKAFVSFVRDCRDSQIKLNIVISPRYIRYRSSDTSIALMRKIAKKYDVAVYNFLKDSAFLNHSSLFADRSHLNDSGATIFCRKVLDTISRY